jgi:hypothetical protein
MRLRFASDDIVLAGDSCYFCRTLRERRLPRFGYDHAQMHASLDRLAMLEGLLSDARHRRNLAHVPQRSRDRSEIIPLICPYEAKPNKHLNGVAGYFNEKPRQRARERVVARTYVG